MFRTLFRGEKGDKGDPGPPGPAGSGDAASGEPFSIVPQDFDCYDAFAPNTVSCAAVGSHFDLQARSIGRRRIDESELKNREDLKCVYHETEAGHARYVCSDYVPPSVLMYEEDKAKLDFRESNVLFGCDVTMPDGSSTMTLDTLGCMGNQDSGNNRFCLYGYGADWELVKDGFLERNYTSEQRLWNFRNDTKPFKRVSGRNYSSFKLARAPRNGTCPVIPLFDVGETMSTFVPGSEDASRDPSGRQPVEEGTRFDVIENTSRIDSGEPDRPPDGRMPDGSLSTETDEPRSMSTMRLPASLVRVRDRMGMQSVDRRSR